MKRPTVIKDEKWRWLDESHPVNDYVKELHKYIDYLESKAENLPISDAGQRLYISKTRWGTYEVLNEQQYERKLIFG